ncbi:MAG: 16S rRNA (cytosine(1402)-N(4))-methyltransferase RsmH [Azospirillaceae bacterium]
MTAPTHIPVLLTEVVTALAPRAGEVHVDATFGRGGYTRAILDAAPVTVIGVDRDPAAIAAGEALAVQSDGRLHLAHGPFGDLEKLVAAFLPADGKVDGVVFDLGVSSPQIDDPARGFSFRQDGPLDMRMGAEGESAAELVNRAEEEELVRIIREFGEERHARRVARAIVAARRDAPLTRTATLAEVVRRVVPRSRDGIDPATRTFQAIRIAVNDELGELDRGLCAAERLLRAGGRLVVVSFHSLEDRRVKAFLAARSGRAAGPSRHLPVPANDRAPSFRDPTRKPVTATLEERSGNPRAASARLRAAIRTDAPAWPETGAAA